MLLSECLQAEFFSPMTIIHDILSNLAILAIFVIDLFMPALFNWLKYFHALVNYYSILDFCMKLWCFVRSFWPGFIQDRSSNVHWFNMTLFASCQQSLICLKFSRQLSPILFLTFVCESVEFCSIILTWFYSVQNFKCENALELRFCAFEYIILIGFRTKYLLTKF